MRPLGGTHRLFRYRALLQIPFIAVLLFPALASARVGMQEETSRLAERRPTLFHVVRGAAKCLAFVPGSAADAEIFVESSAPDLAFEVRAPDLHRIQAVSAEYPDWLPLAVPLDARGNYSLCVSARPHKQSAERVAFRADLVLFHNAAGNLRAKAETLFTSAATLSRSHQAVDVRRAVDLYRQAGSVWDAAGDREGHLLALACAAQTLLKLSKYDRAIAALNLASAIPQSDPFWDAWLANLESQVYLDRWESVAASSYSQKAQRLSRSVDDDWLRADVLADQAESEYLTHNDSATPDVGQAFALARLNGATRTLARALRCHAWIEKDQGKLTRAFALMDQARQYFHEDGDFQAELQAMATLATIQSISGDLYSALLRHTEIADLMRVAGETAHYAILEDNIGEEYELLSRVSDAIVYYEQALTEYKATGHLAGQAMAHFNLCSALKQQNSLHRALGHCEAGLAIVKTFHDPKRTAAALWERGNVEHALGDNRMAQESFRAALSLSRKVHDANFEARALLSLGEVLKDGGDAKDAGSYLREAQRESDLSGDVPLQVDAYYSIAESEFDAGHVENAKADLEKALDKVIGLRGRVANPILQASYFAQERKCQDLKVNILMREREDTPESNASASALEANESGRALSLIDSLASRNAKRDSGRHAQASKLLELHDAVERAYDQRLELLIAGAHQRDLDANANALTLAIDRLERTEDEQRASDDHSLTPAPRTLSAADIVSAGQKLHVTMIEYMLGKSQSYAWVVDNGKIASYVLPPRQQIEDAVKRWRILVTAREPREGETFDARRRRVDLADRELPSAGAKLSCILLGRFLKPEMEHLVIVPDGELALLPFAALPANGCQAAKGEFVLAHHQVQLAPSLSTFLLPREAPSVAATREDVAILADPVFDPDDPRVHQSTGPHADTAPDLHLPALPRLLGTRDEAEAIVTIAAPHRTALYLGFEANLQTLFDPTLRQYRILHLATHGIFDQRRPDFSGIVLSLVGPDGRSIPGFLNGNDIAKLDLPLDLVVLSSCSSGEGTNLSGEGVTGLDHAFFRAGAQRVVSTIWSVDDETSEELMKEFYWSILRDELDPAEALRRSQLKLLLNPRTASPYYWAGYETISVKNGPTQN